MKKSLLLLSTLALCSARYAIGQTATTAQPVKKYEANWASLDSRPIPQWYQDAKFGIFIHWGVYSVPSWAPKGTYAEWYWHSMQDKNGATWKFHEKTYGADFPYENFAPLFKADLFKPEQWAEVFVRSGAKYVVLTSKHHEGFALWPNQDASRDWGRPWNSVEVGPKRDLLGDLTTAVRARGLKMGFYYSLYEWYNPLYKNNFAKFRDEHFFPQFKDVVTRYKPSIIFADGEWEHTAAEWHSPELLAWLYNDSGCGADLIIDDRWGSDTRGHHGGYYTTEYGGGTDFKAGPGHQWEESRGIGASYGYNRNEDYDDYRTRQGLIQLLIQMVSQGGNLLLDIGPTADGRIPVVMQDRLISMGNWLKVNGDAIYGTGPSPYGNRKFDWGALTTKPGKIFVHLFKRPGDTLTLSGLKNQVTAAYLLSDATHKPLAVKSNASGVNISLPDYLPDENASVIVLEINGQPNVDLTIAQQANGTLNLEANTADIHGTSPRVENRAAGGNIGFWNNPKDSISWTFNVTHPGEFQGAINYACENGAGGSEYVVSVDNQQLVGRTRDTGGWDHFVRQDLGRIKFSQPGKYTLTMQPKAEPAWKMINVESITLRPVK
ncbi:MAG: alpha-L-fucosidase [Abitibacteriaceae bacterium]|nr:alpha-L-fucosidase [Abditibacteriaceae bacterium]MBV9866670.1 alpha-L-fucosidase [Abditibacteriaceae bacterium]